jgi:hypothetical protein
MRSAASLSLVTLSVSSLALAVLGAGCGEPGAEDVETRTGAVVASFTPLTLSAGWTNSPFSTAPAASAVVDGIVYLRGAVATTGTFQTAFVLPAGRRPPTPIYVPVNLYGAAKGRLQIDAGGAVTVSDRDGGFSAARGFTSLEGVSFPISNGGHTQLALQNGWQNAGGVGRNAAAIVVNGIVHLSGALNTFGTNMVPFTLPAAMRPAATVYAPIDLTVGHKGRLVIAPTGTVTVQAEDSVDYAKEYTSLEGVTFPVSNTTANGWLCLTPTNGWVAMPFSTRNTCVKNVDGIIRFSGSVGNGTTSTVFTLPTNMEPSHAVYVAIDMCGAKAGRMIVQTNGQVSVQAEGAFSTAQCFSSFEGASFSP